MEFDCNPILFVLVSVILLIQLYTCYLRRNGSKRVETQTLTTNNQPFTNL